MSNEFNETQEKEISIATLLKSLRKHIVAILVATLIFAVLAGGYSMLFQSTRYSATSQFYVKNILSTSGYIPEGMIAGGTKIADSCVDIATTDVLATEAVDQCNLTITFGLRRTDAVNYVKSMISAGKRRADSQEFYITVTSNNKEHTFEVSKAVQQVMEDVVKKITTANADSVSAPGLLPTKEINEIEEVATIKPSTVKMAIIGALLGFVASYVIFLIIDLKDTKVYDEETIKAKFSYPIIASIPQWTSESDDEAKRLSRKKLLARDISKSGRNYSEKLMDANTPFAIVESFKLLRTNLSYSVTTSDTPVFAVTSDFSGAGKSIVSSNLAVAFAQFGKRTLLVEGDMRCPDFHHLFKSNLKETGLSELLSANASLGKETYSDTGIENLTVISSGRIPPNPSELLGSGKMGELITAWKNEFDVVIIDLPPVFEVTDACVISSYVDGYVLVARTEHSDVDALNTSLGNINRVQGNVCGFVLNDVNIKIGSSVSSPAAYAKYGKYAKYRKYSNYVHQSTTQKEDKK